MAKFCIYEEHGGICTLSDHPCIVGGPCECLEEFAPVEHGQWVDKQGGFWETATCNICGEKYPTVGVTPNYCPNCGARMDGAE